MWCPRCRGEFREEVTHCPSCDLDLVANAPATGDDYPMGTGPLTGRPVDEELESTGPALAGSFVTMDEAQSALRALADAGIEGEICPRDDMFPTTISGVEPGLGVSVDPRRLGKAREVLRTLGLLPAAVARFRQQEDAQAALRILEARGLTPRLSILVLEEVPAEFREDMEPYTVEVPAEQEAAAMEILEREVLRLCESCGSQIRKDDVSCRTCGESVAV
jgi:hypothetical protein